MIASVGRNISSHLPESWRVGRDQKRPIGTVVHDFCLNETGRSDMGVAAGERSDRKILRRNEQSRLGLGKGLAGIV